MKKILFGGYIMAKKKGSQKQKTDQIHLKLVKTEIWKKMYKLSFQVIIDGSDGKAKANTPFVVFYRGEKIIRHASDANGIANFGYRLKYDSAMDSLNLICKIVGSTAKCFETFRLPAPREVKFTSSSIKQNEDGFTASFAVQVLDNTGKARPNCPIKWSGNGVAGKGYSDINGCFSFKDDSINKSQSNDSLAYTVNIGQIYLTEKITIPLRKGEQLKWSKKLNTFPNWKYNRKKTIGSFVKTIIIFSLVLAISFLAGTFGQIFASLVLGGFVYWRSKDDDGKYHGITAIIFIGISLLMLSSLPFVAIMIILSQIVYLGEEFSRPIDPETTEGLAHPLNPYPKWPIIFGLVMVCFCLLDIVPSSMLQTNMIDVLNGQNQSSLIDILNHQSSLTDKLWSFIVNIWKSASQASSWLNFCLILTIYASPEEIMNFIQKSGGGGGAVGLGSLFYTLRDLADPLLGWLIRKKRR